ncbi:MAG: sigma-70 family RNA polymerase sigma factor [Acidimicrobiia bacterium]|nr:sigma-70 family RNA polymerase sigma factor [Acidimicrobiia bacterium]MDH4306246.1 sigma-70 family RNA polymerase sigma factor [Acidimicrobiia bacterium]MDH5294383.1 sigma-70 family RNA polymerase sigma factor [Acidimicrobiia bacterium]
MVDPTDAELLAAAARGDGDSFSVFFRRYARPVTLYAVRRCRDPHDVGDLVSETFLVALQAAGRYIPQTDTALPWLFGIARRVLARQHRRRASHRRLAVKAGNVEPLVTGDEVDAIAEAIDASRQRRAIEAALATLSDGEREIFLLVAYDGLSPGEAAVVVGVSANAARLRLSRARRRMREELDPALRSIPEARHAF